MSKTEYLKRKNVPIVTVFIMWCLAIYLTFQCAPSGFWSELQATISELRLKEGVALIMSPVLALVLTGLISPANKARLVFWKWKHALPGHAAFSLLAPKDPRIDMALLGEKIGSVPTDPEMQNRLWYSLYKQEANKPAVAEAHRVFLLARDLSCVSLLFAVFGPWSLAFFGHTFSWILVYFAAMVVHYIVLAVVAQNHGRRFVCNVLAEHLAR